MVRYNTNNSTSPGAWTIAGPVLWTDYPAGGRSPVPYEDVQTDAWLGTWQPVRRYFGLAGDQTLDAATGDVLGTAYWAGDLIDSTMAATDATGFVIDYTGGTGFQPVAYTAFGEILDDSGTPGGAAPAGFPRYQYAGGWGYESDLLALPGANSALSPVTLQHLGWRWYDPAIGRFVQRDPIGLVGGLNSFQYVFGRPTALVDPTGERFWNGDNPFHDWVARNFWLRFHSRKWILSPGATAEAVGLSVVGGVAIYCATPYTIRAGFRLFGRSSRIGIHGPHHPFGRFGKLPHIQINWWRPGIKGSGGVIRIPLFPGADTPVF